MYRDQLEDSNNLKERLLDIITHDLKNPAGVISGLAKIVREESPNNEKLNLIDESSDRLLAVVNNATTLCQFVLGEAITLKKLDLVKIISDVLPEFLLQLENAGMKLDSELPPQLIVHANPIIPEIFKIYISNVIKYSSDGKKIVVELKKD
ncbi:MAG: HAMP domain-containing histidine kinase [Candidatus Marinimicrobia bacterium]|nr:HAMP domain-containing histidine kinase [Candidatus Neomarinimicrobiota bacterium]